ncbi:MAG: hypothetical protein AB1430_22100 [Pseudomonadota bacterium]
MKNSVVELFAHAADRARDVAVMMDAARALTVLGQRRLSGDPAPEGPGVDPLQVEGLYQTAERLGEHVRQVSCEARSLLVTAKQMLQMQPEIRRQVPPDFDDVCKLLDEAMDRAVEAVERLEAMRFNAVRTLFEAESAGEPPPDVRRLADGLIDRLRHRR